jgi:hypothetical protein
MTLKKPTTLQNICTTQETSRKLKEAGFPQEGGIAYWCSYPITNYRSVWSFKEIPKINWQDPHLLAYRAFTFNEPWEILPKKIEIEYIVYYLGMYKDISEGREYIGYLTNTANFAEGDSLILMRNELKGNPQEAAAELALWCVKEGHLDVREDT